VPIIHLRLARIGAAVTRCCSSGVEGRIEDQPGLVSPYWAASGCIKLFMDRMGEEKIMIVMYGGNVRIDAHK
jgi:hypothetical protein